MTIFGFAIIRGSRKLINNLKIKQKNLNVNKFFVLLA